MEFNCLLKTIEDLEKELVWSNVSHVHSFGRVPDEEDIRLWQIPPTTGSFLKLLVELLRPMHVLEIGTSVGYSTLWMAEPLSYFNGTIDTIEIFEPKIEIAKKHFTISKLTNISIIEGDAVSITKDYTKCIDLLFLDADKENYINYLKNIECHLNNGATIIADNAVDYKYLMEDFLDYIDNNKSYQSIILNFDHGLLLAKFNHE